jgi:SAM-dependent methyltransferase
MPLVSNPAAWARFRELASAQGLDANDRWVGGYVTYEWLHGRHFFESYMPQLAGKRIMEFGCNVGATGVVLAMLGAEVTGIDVDANFVALAQANAEAHGQTSRLRAMHVDDTRRLPFENGSFDMIVCNSVLEYVDADARPDVQRELERVLRSSGLLLVLGTSNRLWPREVHSGRWLVNYLPRRLDRIVAGTCLQRGASPFSIMRHFLRCRNFDAIDAGKSYLDAKQRTGTSAGVLRLLGLITSVLAPFGWSVGMFMPSIGIAFVKE